MNIEAAATALVQDDVAPAQTETPTDDDALEAIYDSMGVDDEPEAEEAPEPEKEDAPELEADEEQAEDDAEEKDEPEAETADEAPSELPLAIKKNWAAIPQEARDAFLEAQRESNRKLGEQGRLVQGIGPIRDVLTEAVKQMPALSDMSPQQVAKEVFELAQVSQNFKSNPVQTMMGLIKQHGMEQALSQALSGQQVTQDAQGSAALTQEVAALKQTISRLTDPEYMETQFSSFSTKHQAEQTVEQFASSKTDWSDVEPYMPQAISFVQSMAPDISTQDVLTRAYDLALGQVKPDAIKAETPAPAPKAAAVVDPDRSRKAQKAKAVNVNGQAPGKPRAKTEDELFDQIWAKNQS